MPTAQDHQRDATRTLLGATAGRGFALAGSSAIREHGLIQRPTADVDLFSSNLDPEPFAEALEAGTRALCNCGYAVSLVMRADQFARVTVTASDGYSFDVDMGVDWRAHEPVTLSIGPVLDIEDAVANKVDALYSRAYPRDFLDVDAIRRSGRFTDEALIESATNHDPGFDREMFTRQLALVDRLRPEDVSEYGYTAEDLDGVRTRLRAWIHDLRGEEGSGGGFPGTFGLRQTEHRVGQSYRSRESRSRRGELER